MNKKILFSLRSPYREQLDVVGFRFGHGRKSLAIVGAMRGNEVQQMYVWAIQWHPEFSCTVSEESRMIFGEFVNNCK